MRKWLRLGLCLGALTVALTCSALAATSEYTTDKEGTVDYSASTGSTGKYTATYDKVISGNQYALLVVKGTEADHPINENTIMYIDQKAASGSTISFDFIPKSTPDCVVLLGGVFNGEVTSPVTLGTLIGKGVTVSGSVTSYNPGNPTTVELYTAGTNTAPVASTTIAGTSGSGQTTQRFELTAVPSGVTYDLKITKQGHTPYWLKGIPVDEDMTLSTIPSLLCGDVNGDGGINVNDLGIITSTLNYNKSTNEANNELADLNGDNGVNVNDLGIMTNTKNYNQGTVTVIYQGN